MYYPLKFRGRVSEILKAAIDVYFVKSSTDGLGVVPCELLFKAFL